MGLIDKLTGGGGSRDFAQEFKKAFDDNNWDKLQPILDDWNKADQADPNCQLALIMMTAPAKDIEFRKLCVIFDGASKNKLGAKIANPGLNSWFISSARTMLSFRARDEGVDLDDYI